jgi:hypothetical protein
MKIFTGTTPCGSGQPNPRSKRMTHELAIATQVTEPDIAFYVPEQRRVHIKPRKDMIDAEFLHGLNRFAAPNANASFFAIQNKSCRWRA